MNSRMARRASEAYVPADSSKIGWRAFATMDEPHFHKIITGSSITAQQLAAFADYGTEVIVAPDLR